MTHEKKLFDLWEKRAERCPHCIANYSKKRLTLQERNALRFGLNNPILPKKVEKEKIKTRIENLTSTLKGNADVTMNEDTKDDIQFLVNRFTDDANRVVPNVLISLYITLY